MSREVHIDEQGRQFSISREISVTFEMPGIHSYPNAVINHNHGVEFLEFPHRHMFKFKVTVPVSHAERELEFFLFQNWCGNFVRNHWPLYESIAMDFGADSCETIAMELAKAVLDKYLTIGRCSVEVSEDGENAAAVTLTSIRQAH